MVYTLKTPYRDGTTQVAFEPIDFVARLAALVPKPRVNLSLANSNFKPPPVAEIGCDNASSTGN